MTTENTPSLFEVIDSSISGRLSTLHVGMPARVETYDASELRVSVKPLIRRVFEDETTALVSESLPVIDSVPVIFQGAGSYRITFPINKGDIVWLMFSSASLDEWLAKGGEVDPVVKDERRFHLSDAVAIPGIYDFKNARTAKTDALVIETPTEIRLGDDTASDPVALKSDLTTLKSYLDAHTHLVPGATGGGGGLTTNSPSASPTPVASTKVKAV